MTIDTVLENPTGGTPQPKSLDELKALATEMARYYHRGFAESVKSIIDNARRYEVLASERLLKETYTWLGKINEIYSAIPFNDLEGREEFRPLFLIRDRLPMFKFQVNEIFERKRKDSFDLLRSYGIKIIDIGKSYSAILSGLLNEIKMFPEGKDFTVSVKNIFSGAEAAY